MNRVRKCSNWVRHLSVPWCGVQLEEGVSISTGVPWGSPAPIPKAPSGCRYYCMGGWSTACSACHSAAYFQEGVLFLLFSLITRMAP